MTGIYTGAVDALKNMTSYSSDVIITDIKMSEVNGLGMTDRMRETDQEAHIIILSGCSDLGSVQGAIELGVTRCLTKPTKRRELLGVLKEIEGKMSEKQKGDEKKKEASNLMVQEAMDYIALDYSEKINLKNTAEELYLSPSYPSELSKRHTDKNIPEYITQFHLDRAGRYLRQPEYKTMDVSDLVGSGDLRYFDSVLRRRYGTTPNKYRNRSAK